MPPKKAPPPASAKQKAKIVEDKTFGLKNKNKSKKVADYVQQVQKQVNTAGGKKKPEEDPKLKAQRKKEEEEARKAELALLYKPIQAQKAPPGVDPKSLLCEFFKSGTCTKGSKCKFSHDLAVDRKSAKIDIYTDQRDEEKKNDTMENWDQETLEQVVKQKGVGKKIMSDIICKYFLDALEKSQYGWFWECPNGETCHYRHALPPGFVLKKDQKKKKEEGDAVSLEEYIERERQKIKGALTPVNEETFAEWKKRRLEKKKQEEEERAKEKEAAAKAGKGFNLSGRDLFTYRPDLFVDDEEGADADVYEYSGSEQAYSDDEGDGTRGIEPDEDTGEDHIGTSSSRDVTIEESLFVGEMEDLDIEDEGDDEGEGADEDGGEEEEQGEDEDK